MPEPPRYKVCARAPLRLDLAGGASDLSPLAGGPDGSAAAVALSLGIEVEVWLGGGTIRLGAAGRAEHLTLRSAAGLVYDGQYDAPKAALNMLPVTGGIEIFTRSEAPPAAGLGGRAARDVALLAALAHCRNDAYQPAELAELAFQLETEELQRVAGREDCYLAALGGAQQLTFGREAVRARALADEAERLAEFTAHLVLAHPGPVLPADRAARQNLERLAAGEPAVLAAVAAVAELAAAAAAAWEAGAWRRLAEVFDEAARAQAAWDAWWALERTQAAVRRAREAGAWGAKPAGPRPGSSLAVLAPPERRAAVAAALAQSGARVLECGVARQGVRVWRESLPES